MTEVMLALGEYRFSVETAAYETLSRTDTWRWQEQARLGREPAHQYLGPGVTSVQLPGVILPHYKGGLGQIDRIREEAGKGEPLNLVDGLGKVWGAYCIKQIQETQSRTLANGAPRKIEFSVDLVKYGEDAAHG